MSYPKHIYNKVKTFYDEKRMSNQQSLENKINKIYKEIPRIQEIDKEIQMLGINLSKAMLENTNSENAFEEMKSKTLQLNMEKCEKLVENGYPSDYLMEKHQCSICKDEGFINGKMCSCFANKLKEEAYLASNLPLVMDKQSFDTFNLDYYPDDKTQTSPKVIMGLILDICRNYANNFGEASENLLMYGGTGLGKTFMSSCIAKRVLEDGYSVFYNPSYKIFSIFEENKFGNENKDILKVQIDNIFKTDLLIIDDLGTELVTTYTAEVLFDLLNSRLNSGKKTIINTNLSLADLERVYSPRITSRIIGNYLQLKFCGEDIRRMDD